MENQQEPNERYIENLRLAVTNQCFILLQASDGLFAMFEDSSERAYIPVWADNELALKAAAEEWVDYQITSMSIKEFREWLKDLKTDEIYIGAFPDEQLKVTPLSPDDFRAHINSMLDEVTG